MSKRPNILFIMTDQQHSRMLSCAGNVYLHTPAMDSLAQDGIRFEKAFCTNPVCVPSRTSMATGMMPNRLGASSNVPGMKIRDLPRKIDEHSLGKVVKSAGYDTFYGGKVHMCESLQPEKAGYDDYFQDERDSLPAACLEFIRRKRDKPFLAVASFINPHDICFAHHAYNGIDTHGVLELHMEASSLPIESLPPLPDNFAIPQNEPSSVEVHASTTAITPSGTMRKEYDERDWRINRWIYHRLTEQVDQNIGTILDGLRDSGLEDNTLFIFTSDHGNMDASHRLASKSFYYEESVSVPLILKYRRDIPAGITDQRHLISTGLDILPTICDYAGVDKPTHLLGRSLRGISEDRCFDEWRSYIACENDWFRMIRSGKYKYCSFSETNSEDLLVDIENDPGEMRNLVDDSECRDILAEHRRLLAEWISISDDNEGSEYIKNG